MDVRQLLHDSRRPRAAAIEVLPQQSFVALANVAITLFTSSLLGYIFAKYEFRFSKVLFWFLMATMMVPAR